MSPKVAVVTGSNKGIGFAIVKKLCQQFSGKVYLTSRSDENGLKAVQELRERGFNPEYHQLDVTDRESVKKLRDDIKAKYGGIDILINNAGILNEGNTYNECKSIIDINYRSIFNIKEYIFDMIRDNGRIINISSDCGHLSNIKNKYWSEKLSQPNLNFKEINDFVEWYLSGVKNGTFNKEDIADDAAYAAYRVSKVALSAITMIHQKELEHRNIAVNSMHPGLVRTDMTKDMGFFSIDDAANTPVYLALEAPQTLMGQYLWFDGRVLDWYNANANYYFKSATIRK